MCGISCPEGREMKWHCTSNHTVPLIRKGNAQNHRRIIFVDQPLPPLRLVEISIRPLPLRTLGHDWKLWQVYHAYDGRGRQSLVSDYHRFAQNGSILEDDFCVVDPSHGGCQSLT